LELIKSDIKNPQNQVVMYKVLEKFLRAAHPFMPFITEEIWQLIPHEGESIMLQGYPHIQQQLIDKKTEGRISLVFEMIVSIRNMRQDLEIPLTAKIKLTISSPKKENSELISLLSPYIKNLTKAESIDLVQNCTHMQSSITSVIKDTHVTIPLEGLIDIEKEKNKISSRMTQAEKEIASKEKTLSNKEFLKKAPEEVVAKEKERLNELRESLKKLKAVKDGLR
jgi:valyl-tRNA synthetase